MNWTLTKRVVVFFLTFYFLFLALHPDSWTILNSVNLIFHEAGHTLFSFFGECIHIAAGSLFQILFPFVFVLYFWRHGENYSAALLLFWVGENILEVAHYAADAQIMILPLLGGDGVIHDWNYLLTTFGVIKHTPAIAHAIFFVGIVVICLAFVLGLRYSDQKKN